MKSPSSSSRLPLHPFHLWHVQKVDGTWLGTRPARQAESAIRSVRKYAADRGLRLPAQLHAVPSVIRDQS